MAVLTNKMVAMQLVFLLLVQTMSYTVIHAAVESNEEDPVIYYYIPRLEISEVNFIYIFHSDTVLSTIPLFL